MSGDRPVAAPVAALARHRAAASAPFERRERCALPADDDGDGLAGYDDPDCYRDGTRDGRATHYPLPATDRLNLESHPQRAMQHIPLRRRPS